MLKQEPMKEHPRQRGSIVNIASQLGIVARPGAGKFVTVMMWDALVNVMSSCVLRVESCNH
jgi:hypothetical protein